MMHARDRQAWTMQKTAVAVCGRRVQVRQTAYLPGMGSETVTCVGCRAVVRERERETLRAAGERLNA